MNKMGVTSPSGKMRVLAEHIHIYPTFLIPFIPFIPVNPNRHKKARLRSVVGDGRIAGVSSRKVPAVQDAKEQRGTETVADRIIRVIIRASQRRNIAFIIRAKWLFFKFGASTRKLPVRCTGPHRTNAPREPAQRSQ
jgi:hypothetical protein